MDIIFLFISFFLTILCFYLFFQLKLKRKEGKTLEEKNLSILSSIDQEGKNLKSLIESLKDKRQEGENLEGENKTILESIEQEREKLESIVENLKNKKIELDNIIQLEKNQKDLQNKYDQTNLKYSKLKDEIKLLTDEETKIKNNLSSIKEKLSIYHSFNEFVQVGFFEEPDYLYETSERFKAEIKIVREKQKLLIKNNEAIHIPDTIALSSDSAQVKRILEGQANLMLKAFNIECDNLIGNVKPSNYALILEKIDKLAEDLEKNTASLLCGFNKEYIELKFKECELQYQFKLKEMREKEEQDIIKEQMREEQKAIKEYERALAKAEKEEEMYLKALDKARLDLIVADENTRQKLEDKIGFLEIQLKEALENKERAKSMAEQTRRGHVYIISNIGSFGENVYKIGLTRRLVPEERVQELSSASVPFKFDIHAMIYSEDAPALETQLHHEFRYQRLNVINMRKEFFNVTLNDIKEKAKKIIGKDVDFRITALAEEYYESLKLKGKMGT